VNDGLVTNGRAGVPGAPESPRAPGTSASRTGPGAPWGPGPSASPSVGSGSYPATDCTPALPSFETSKWIHMPTAAWPAMKQTIA
jgi:hypothetical protein